MEQGKDPAEEYGKVRHDPPLPKDLCEQIVPLFERLADRNLLKRCMQLQTSNANESLHSTLWQRAPKSKYCGRKTVETATALAIMQFNKGSTGLIEAAECVGVPSGRPLEVLSKHCDHLLLYQAEHQCPRTARKQMSVLKV